MLYVLYKKGYDYSTCLCENLDFRLEMTFRYCDTIRDVVILGKGGSAKASLHYFTLFHTLKINKLYLYGLCIN